MYSSGMHPAPVPAPLRIGHDFGPAFDDLVLVVPSALPEFVALGAFDPKWRRDVRIVGFDERVIDEATALSRFAATKPSRRLQPFGWPNGAF